MEVHITLEKRATDENKHLMNFLHNNVDVFKRDMQMNISTVSSAEAAQQRLRLPMVRVGQRPAVCGGKAIIAEIKQAHGTIGAMTSQDPVEEFWREGIKKGADESSNELSGANEAEVAQRFTLETQHRQRAEEMRKGKAGSRPLPPAAKPLRQNGVPSAPRSGGNGGGGSRAAHSSGGSGGSGMSSSAGSGSGDLTSADIPINNATAPEQWMKSFWQNQMVTPGA